MSDVWRICVVESDVSLNQNLVNSLRKDGYVVQGVLNIADAMRILWSEECDVVICGLNLPGVNGLELLRWLRAYRSNVRSIVLGEASKVGDNNQRLQALESGAVSYIEKPVDMRVLRDELRRLLQQTGFTASLDSFDLLDVIQIITMSRKSIVLHINIGLEERGTLCFQNGDLVWAEYGVLRGEEAFFALAAHKNGTVTQQLSDQQFPVNVTQPLSRLIFQALQYRTKYANKQQLGSGQDLGQGQAQSLRGNLSENASPSGPLEVDDSPFLFTSEGVVSNNLGSSQHISQVTPIVPPEPIPPVAQVESPGIRQQKEWWELPGQAVGGEPDGGIHDRNSVPTSSMDVRPLREAMNNPQSLPLQGETSALKKDSSQLPSWLTDMPTSTRIPVRNSTPIPPSGQMPGPSPSQSTPGVSGIYPLQASQVPFKTTDELSGNQQSASYMQAFPPETEERRSSSSQWSLERQKPSSSAQHRLTGQSGVFERTQGRQNSLDGLRENNPMLSSTSPQVALPGTRKNYAALVSALQTLGYSLPGFVAAAVVDADSHPLAQVAIDETDISQTWQFLGIVQRSALNALQSSEWGVYEETILTTASRQVLMRAIGSDKKAFLMLITTREANFSDSLEIMANVEGAINAALR